MSHFKNLLTTSNYKYIILIKTTTMKKYILILLILFGLNASAQVDWCDSISYSVLPNTNGVFSVMIETTDSLDNYRYSKSMLHCLRNRY